MPAAIPIFIGLAAGGTALDVFGKIKAGNAANRIGEFNARVAETQAADALARGAEDEHTFRAQVRGVIGSQRAGFSGQNVDVGGGSALDVQADAAFLGELDALTIRNNAAREAWGYRQEAENARLGGSQAQSASRWGAASSIVGGAASILQMKYGWGSERNDVRARGDVRRSANRTYGH
jgi:hypothetical protein